MRRGRDPHLALIRMVAQMKLDSVRDVVRDRLLAAHRADVINLYHVERQVDYVADYIFLNYSMRKRLRGITSRRLRRYAREIFGKKN